MIFNKHIIIIVSILCFLTSYGQETYPDCINPKKIVVPLANDLTENKQDEIYYQPEDKYTYWYKTDVTSDCQISYELS
jgi:hypothetical protein